MAERTVNLDHAEARRQAMQHEIDAGRSAVQRNRLGQFATPNALAVEIVRWATDHWLKRGSRVHFADPAIGTGSFYSAALRVLGPDRIASAVGIELDPRLCSGAREIWQHFGLRIIEGDFTSVVESSSCPPSPDLILANPPYVRHHHLSRDDKGRLQRLTKHMCGVDVNGLAGLYVYFVLLASAWMKNGGAAAWLIPSEFMDVNYGAALKAFLTDRVRLERVHRFAPEDVQFGDALVSSVVLFFLKEQPTPDHVVEFSYGGTLEHPAAVERVPLGRLREARKWTVYPAHDRNDRCLSGNTEGPTLGDLFRVQRGIATGCNKFFLLQRAEAQRLGLPAGYLRPVLPSPRILRATVIERDPDGYPAIEPQLCVIDCDLPEHLVEQRHPTLWAYFQAGKARGLAERYLCNKRDPWYRQEQREPAPFLSTYMGRGNEENRPFRFIWNRSDATATNLYLLLYPRGPLARLLTSEPEKAATVHALLNELTGHELRGEGRVYGGGLNKIEPSELGRVSAARFVDHFPDLGRSRGGQEQLALSPVAS